MFHLDRVDHVCGVSEAGQVRGRGGGELLQNLELSRHCEEQYHGRKTELCWYFCSNSLQLAFLLKLEIQFPFSN